MTSEQRSELYNRAVIILFKGLMGRILNQEPIYINTSVTTIELAQKVVGIGIK